MSTEPIAEQPEIQRFPGERLQAARLAKGITVEQISTSLHLPETYIHAIENGELEKLPSIVFARGYVRSYATIVDVDAEEFLGYMDELYGARQNTRAVRSVTKVRQQVKVGHPVVKTFSWMIGGVVVAASVWWWNTQNAVIDPGTLFQASETTASVESAAGEGAAVAVPEVLVPAEDAVVVDANPEAPRAPAPADVAAAPATATAEPGSGTTETVVAQPPAERSASDPSVPAIDAPAVVAAEPAATDADANAVEVEADAEVAQAQQQTDSAQSRLTVTFSDDCWVTIRGSDGKSLFNNVRRKGDVLDLTGEAPFSVLLGAAHAVTSLSFNGEDVDLKPFSKNNVARLTLPLE